LKLHGDRRKLRLGAEQGINVRKLDKGCLILNIEQEEGYKILIVDNSNKSEAQYWKMDFLNIKPSVDAFHQTHNFMNLTRQYVGDQLDEEFSVTKADKIDLLNRSVNFFKSHDIFNQNEFETEVLEDASVIESFRKYEKSLDQDSAFAGSFEISAPAVKRQVRIFKSVLKLDKNFHIYIHGNRDLIEKGFDETKNRHFYKIYFDQET
jgi:CRISPR/Cas system-associated endonuclease/helicase Cas3